MKKLYSFLSDYTQEELDDYKDKLKYNRENFYKNQINKK